MSSLKFKNENGEWQTITGTSSVVSFNGRAGAIKPRTGDYTAEMVGADEAGSAASALTNAKTYTDEQIAAIPAPDISGQIASHNSSSSAHSDIRGAIPIKVSQLTNDKGYITGYTETDPTVPSWAKAASKPSYTYSEVGAAPVIKYGTSDVAAGSASSYAEGTLYVVLE